MPFKFKDAVVYLLSEGQQNHPNSSMIDTHVTKNFSTKKDDESSYSAKEDEALLKTSQVWIILNSTFISKCT